MWPWEHLAVAYICYSALTRVLTGSPPDWRETLVLAFGTQFPDLIDKPLAWELGVLPTGTSLAHSLFTAVPVSVFVVVLGRRRGTPYLGIAFAVGYLLHLPGDVIYPVLYGGGLWIEFLFWPLVPTQPGNVNSFVYKFGELVARTVQYMSSPAGRLYIALEIGLLVSAATVWYSDGMPVADIVRVTIARVRTRV
jgi:hypothetical protein